MESFEKKTVVTSRGHTYTYYVGDGNKSLPAIILLHGWPDHAHMWNGVVGELRKRQLPHTIIVPDMLGYSGTAKPIDSAQYTMKGIAGDLMDIVDAEGFKKLIPIGHDWGAAAAQRVYNFHADRVESLITLNVVYSAPRAENLDLDGFNQTLVKTFGYPLFEYWHFFTEPDTPNVMKDNVERLFTLLGTADGEVMKKSFCTRTGIRDYLEGKSSIGDFESTNFGKDPEIRKAFIERMKRDGFEGPQNWYNAQVLNHNVEDFAKLPPERSIVRVPTLFIGATRDMVCRHEMLGPAVQAGQLPDLEESRLDCGHWSPYEKADEVAEIVTEYLARRFPA